MLDDGSSCDLQCILGIDEPVTVLVSSLKSDQLFLWGIEAQLLSAMVHMICSDPAVI